MRGDQSRGASILSQPMLQPPLDWPHYGVGFRDAIVRGFKKYATFAGRASRSEYWWWTLFTTIVFIALSVPAFVIGMETSPDGGQTPGLPAMPLLVDRKSTRLNSSH